MLDEPEPISFVWRCRWHITQYPGGISDLASTPWPLTPIGVTRQNTTNWKDWGAHAHDHIYFGLARFDDNDRINRQLADALMLDMWHLSSGQKTMPRLKHRMVRLFGWWPYDPDDSLAEEFPWMSIKAV